MVEPKRFQNGVALGIDALSTPALHYALSLPNNHEHWNGCPVPVEEFKAAVRVLIQERERSY